MIKNTPLKWTIFSCRNKKSLKNLSRLVVRPHRDAVYHACFSRDRQRIASCGADKTLQVKIPTYAWAKYNAVYYFDNVC